MTLYLPTRGKTYRYDFEWRGRRYQGTTGMSRLEDARAFERQLRVGLERQAGGLVLRAAETPRFAEWADVFFKHKTERRPLKRPDLLERELRVVLEFWGAKPAAPAPPRKKNAPPRRPVPIAPPYHDLRLGDVLERPEWITEFEAWMRARGTGGAARNHYRSVCSGMYKVAKLPEYARVTGIRVNPFADLERDRPVRRRVTQTVDELRRWITAAPPHVKLALAIGALAPALRLGTILALRWDTSIDADFQFLTVRDHKTDTRDPEPIVIPIVGQLRTILLAGHAAWTAAARRRAEEGKKPPAANVVQFRGKAVKSIKRSLKRAATDAHIPYGVKAAGGATFHTLRHTMATLLAQLGVPEGQRAALLAHADIATTQIYTHLRPVHLVAPLEQLSGLVLLEDVVVPSASAAGKVAGPRRSSTKKAPKTAAREAPRPRAAGGRR